MKKGVPVSPGIAVARAYCVDEVLARQEPGNIDAAAASSEVTRFDAAVHAATLDLDAIVLRVSQQLGEEEAAIFRGHRALLRDPTLLAKVHSAILDRHVDARTALHEVLDEYTGLFDKFEDHYLKERLADVRDVINRVAAQLALREAAPENFAPSEPVIIVAPEILPSQALLLQRFNVAGIITEAGGTTGHAAILARALGIPSVSGLRNFRREVTTGDLIALDGRAGSVHVRPDAETEAAYRKLQREYVNLRDRLIENRDLEPVARDGTRLELLANVNNVADAEMAARTGAGGVGLYRTEYLFLMHASMPDEEEQLTAYRQVIEAAPNRTVTIRTLDIGGDKLVPYIGNHQREANPFMGWRSIRLANAYPDFFQTQLRAIYRAAAHGRVSVLFPMVSTLEEVLLLKRLIARTKLKLRESGVPFADNVPMGVMIEVPAAALCIDAFLREVDFVSIGSNDLTQYVMAADRDNPRVAHLCEPFSPPVLRLLHHIIRHCNQKQIPVTLCGEMAARPKCFLALFGMGLRRLSMSPAFVPTIKELVRSSTLETAEAVARRVLHLKTFRQVRRYLTRMTEQVCPNIATMDTKK